ncbi:hypothetical protein SAMN05216516_101438 [Izhakiella capsodis]|uniref:Uncharacterized protein n=1 Tax=Izhakiella capsodis TaxID=1367852 RepID=A0A1I4UZ00_9GAMM|nr:hypothetical protein SAMN05216516_101438 [Izhakiella capsodis]
MIDSGFYYRALNEKNQTHTLFQYQLKENTLSISNVFYGLKDGPKGYSANGSIKELAKRLPVFLPPLQHH